MRAAVLALGVALWALPLRALACPVCSPDRDDATRQAFFDTTIFLSLLPLAMFGGLVYWAVRRVRAHEALGDQQADLAPIAED